MKQELAMPALSIDLYDFEIAAKLHKVLYSYFLRINFILEWIKVSKKDNVTDFFTGENIEWQDDV